MGSATSIAMEGVAFEPTPIGSVPWRQQQQQQQQTRGLHVKLGPGAATRHAAAAAKRPVILPPLAFKPTPPSAAAGGGVTAVRCARLHQSPQTDFSEGEHSGSSSNHSGGGGGVFIAGDVLNKILFEAADQLHQRQRGEGLLSSTSSTACTTPNLSTSSRSLSHTSVASGTNGNGNMLNFKELEALMLLSRELDNMKHSLQQHELSVTVMWETLERERTLPPLGEALYAELVRTSPKCEALFENIKERQQAEAALIRMVGIAIYFVDQGAIDSLKRIGALHRRHGVVAANYTALQDAFMHILPQFIGSASFEASVGQWKCFWRVAVRALTEGSKTPEGESLGKEYVGSRIAALQADLTLITERQNRCVGREQFVGVMYANAIERDPSLAIFDALKDLRSARRVYVSIEHIAKNLSVKGYDLDEYILELGARHTAYNVSPEHLVAFTDAFAYACKHFLKDEWSIASDSRCREFFTYVTGGIEDGLTSGQDSAENRRAPNDGQTFCMIFTDIEASTDLWQLNPVAMSVAVKNHHALIRTLIAEYGVYEVKTVGDSFIIACADVLIGLKISLQIQLELMRDIPFAPDFTMAGCGKGGGDPRAWDERTLRVRIGMELCTDASAVYDTIHKRYDYYGPSVNRCARIEAAAIGGQILTSRAAFEALQAMPGFTQESCAGVHRGLEIPSPSEVLKHIPLAGVVSVSDVGLVQLKGIGEPVRLVSLVPKCLSGRKFPNTIS